MKEVKQKTCRKCRHKWTPRNSFEKCPAPGCRAARPAPKKLNPVSKKRADEMKAYNLMKDMWMPGKKCAVTGRPAEQVHHIKGRRGKLLCDIKHWLPVTQEGHDWIHNNPTEARAKGWLDIQENKK